ncbi:uncharacterized protein IL334_007698 [Kwoniella shivajii]|uniref:MARVEL domain-containing protein n=1 Tax=Kwoniella shivajii TaxID=564305 RepID=A0ABZ1DBH7_9TREE|nr:hypothetical protein IL334_007698 [Kwoniella shivajii]
METRLPPPSGPPPRYTAVVQKVYPYSLRPVIFFTAGLGFIYGLALGVDSIRDLGNDNETSKEKIFDIIQAILYFVVAGLEAFCIVIAFIHKTPLARFLLFLAPIGILVNLGNQVISVVLHFALKTDLIDQCVKNEVGEEAYNSIGNTISINDDQAQSICDNAWDRGTWSVFAWLFLSVILSLLFGSILLSYYRQVLDPSSVRSRVTNQPQAFQMQPGYNQYPPPNNNQSQTWMVPPYPGPPMNGAPPPPPNGFEKSDYHPEAGWAQEQDSYAPPSGLPPPRGAGTTSVNREEEDAWERAQSQGVTAHLTGHGLAPRGYEETQLTGYRIGNDEEDEAWERARNEGPTAHLTGNGNFSSSRNREGAI